MNIKEINGKHYIDAKVVMLATDKAENSLIRDYRGKLSYHRIYLTQEYLRDGLNSKSFHLYITSNEEIKESDWYLYYMDDKPDLMQCQDEAEAFRCNNHFSIKHICRKIIATTDSSLTKTIKQTILGDNGDWEKKLPQPSKEFIQLFIESYNKGEVITDVLVEAEELNYIKNGGGSYKLVSAEEAQQRFRELGFGEGKIEYQLKLKDNTIIIKEKEDIWDDIISDFFDKTSNGNFPKFHLLINYLKENYHPPVKK